MTEPIIQTEDANDNLITLSTGHQINPAQIESITPGELCGHSADLALLICAGTSYLIPKAEADALSTTTDSAPEHSGAGSNKL